SSASPSQTPNESARGGHPFPGFGEAPSAQWRKSNLDALCAGANPEAGERPRTFPPLPGGPKSTGKSLLVFKNFPDSSRSQREERRRTYEDSAGGGPGFRDSLAEPRNRAGKAFLDGDTAFPPEDLLRKRHVGAPLAGVVRGGRAVDDGDGRAREAQDRSRQ